MSTPNLELPVQPTNTSQTRAVEDVRAMGLAVQGNLVQLRVRLSRSGGGTSMDFGQAVVAPGAVQRFRETLIDRSVLKQYSPLELLLRTHEIWGQYCLMRWSFEIESPDDAHFDFATISDSLPLRCDSSLAVKLAEISGLFWRIRFEQRVREDLDYLSSPEYTSDRELADSIPCVVMGKPVSEASPEELLRTSCEHVGMISALRWIVDRRRVWGEPGIGEISDRPF